MHSEANKKNIRQRVKARQNTVQALYQWFITNKNLDEVISEFENDEYKLVKTDINYFRSLLKGTITNAKNNKTIVVNVKRKYIHPFFKKVISSSKKYHAHDENNNFKIGDKVKIIECKPYSKKKKWEVVQNK